MQDQYNKAFEAGRRSAIEDLFKLLPVEGEHFYFNEPNNYGCITFKWFCGEGNPMKQYAGTEQMGQYHKRGLCPTGRYYLNKDAVDIMLAALNSKPTRN